MAEYESEHTRFMRQWMAQHPEQQNAQKEGRALWWDKPLDPKTAEEYRAAKVAQKSYYYQNEV
ncbi:MAG: hypothetical protein RIR70_2203 [Pseudomonadota bacterium]|jgi:hypothetical protein